jgi:hypothetical protein
MDLSRVTLSFAFGIICRSIGNDLECNADTTANSYARILGVYKNIMPTYSSYLRFF